MCVYRHCPVVITEVPRVVRRKQRALLDAEPLAVGGRSNSLSPNAADRKLMMEVDQRGVGGLDGVLTQEPAAHVLEHVHRNALRALAHGGNAQIRAVGD